MDRRCSEIKPLMPVSGIGNEIDLGASRDEHHRSAVRSMKQEAIEDPGQFTTADQGRVESNIVTAIGHHHGHATPFAYSQSPTNGDPDIRLVKAAKLGDRRAFAELSTRYTTAIYQRMLRLVRNREDAEDLVQETLLKAFNHLGQFRGTAKFSTWLFRISTNSALALLRKKRRGQERPYEGRDDSDESWKVFDFPDPAPNAEQVYAKYQTNCLISLALQRLPKSYQILVRGYHEEERSLADVARMAGISIGAAKSRLFRARVTLRSVLSDPRNHKVLDEGSIDGSKAEI